jgi:hypothetical protein
MLYGWFNQLEGCNQHVNGAKSEQLPKKCDEASLNEVVIVSESFSKTAFSHDFEGRAIGKAPFFISHSPVLAKRLRKLQRSLGDDFHVWIRPDRVYT